MRESKWLDPALIVERIIKIRCPLCRNVIGSTENCIVDADTLMEAARQIKRCPVCNERVRLGENKEGD